MTREETKEAIKVMQAYVDGKKIEFFSNILGKWVEPTVPTWNLEELTYRIASNQEKIKEKHYRPYTMEEFVEEMHKHDGFIVFNGFGDRDWYGDSIIFIDNDFIKLSDGSSHFFEDLCANFVWSDNETPCGKEVEE